MGRNKQNENLLITEIKKANSLQKIQKLTLEELKSNIKWWESKRWIYNIGVGLCGLLMIILAIYGGYSWTQADTFGVIYWGIGANILYSLGILLELLDWYYLNNKIRIQKFRTALFIIGISFSCLWTLWCCMIYFSKPHLW